MLKYLALKLCHFANFEVLVPAVPIVLSYHIVRPVSTLDKAVTSPAASFVKINSQRSVEMEQCGMRNVECGMGNVECGMWNVECGMWNVECGMWNVECGM